MSEPPGIVVYQESGAGGRKRATCESPLLKLNDHIAGVVALEKLEERGRHVVDASARRGLERY